MATLGNEINLDKIDLKILELLQADSSISVNQLAEHVSLTGPACWKRVQRLKTAKVITGEVVLCDQTKLGREITVFVFIKAREHSDKWLKNFAASVRRLPEVTGAYRLSGDIDYLLHVLVHDIAAYDAFYKRLIALTDLANVSSSFSMERIKYTTAIPTSSQ